MIRRMNIWFATWVFRFWSSADEVPWNAVEIADVRKLELRLQLNIVSLRFNSSFFFRFPLHFSQQPEGPRGE